MTDKLGRGTQITGMLLCGLVAVLGAIPVRFRQILGRVAGYIFSLFPSKERQIARLQLKAFLPGCNVEKVTRGVFCNVGQTFFEALNLDPLYKDSSKIELENPELFFSLVKSPIPVLGLTAHVSNWELYAAFIAHSGGNLIVVGRSARSPLGQYILERLRGRGKFSVIWRGGASGTKELISAFEEKRAVGALIDQDTQVKGAFVPFFGSPAHTPNTLVAMGQRYNARIVATFMIRLPHGRYRIKLTEFDNKESTEEILKKFNSELEAIIRAHPDQWVWFHKRWRTCPDGRRLSSKEYISTLEELAPR